MTAHTDLLRLFADWRRFQPPVLVDGVPDYGPAAMAAQHRELRAYRDRLAAIDPSPWPIPQQVDYHIVRAEMNGLDFDHRVLRPWANDPAFYVTVFGSESDQPAREGHYARGSLELWQHALPPDPAERSGDPDARSARSRRCSSRLGGTWSGRAATSGCTAPAACARRARSSSGSAPASPAPDRLGSRRTSSGPAPRPTPSPTGSTRRRRRAPGHPGSASPTTTGTSGTSSSCPTRGATRSRSWSASWSARGHRSRWRNPATPASRPTRRSGTRRSTRPGPSRP